VNFEILVPASVPYSFDGLASVSGNVEVSGIRGRLSAKSVSGNVSVRGFTGVVSASSVSRNVDAEIAVLEGAGDMKFSSVSGGTRVKAPLTINTEIEMSSVSGSLETDFPITIQDPNYGPGRSARGRMGAGGNALRLSSVSGPVSLTRS
jgi:DUF4097 and DUF4098 domain-containing protein YvlB